MQFYDLPQEEQERLEKAGVDYNLRACIEYNPQPFEVTDIDEVLAVWEGENEGDDWRWVIKVKKECAKKNDGRFVFLQGGCDYTGWDCQSSADCRFAETAKKAAGFAGAKIRWREDEGGKVYESLVEQLKTGRNKTWREKRDEEFQTKNLPKISKETK